MTPDTENLRDRPEAETGVLCIEGTPEVCDVIFQAVMSVLEDYSSQHPGMLPPECERRWIARGVVAHVCLGPSPQLDWQI